MGNKNKGILFKTTCQTDRDDSSFRPAQSGTSFGMTDNIQAMEEAAEISLSKISAAPFPITTFVMLNEVKHLPYKSRD